MNAERSLNITILSTLALVVLQGGLTCLFLENLAGGRGGLDLRQSALLPTAAFLTRTGMDHGKVIHNTITITIVILPGKVR